MNLPFDAIIVTADEPFGRMWHTQIIFTNFLARSNKVIYVGPPAKWNPLNLLKKRSNCVKISDNLTVLDYPNQFPSSQNDKNDGLLSDRISKELEALGAKKILIWHFDPFRSSFSDTAFSSKFKVKRIYHVIDPFYHNPLDKWLCEKCDVLVVTSPRNNDHYKGYAHKLINLPQCVDLREKEHLSGKSSHSIEYQNYFVLLGTISQDIDFDLLNDLVKDPGFNLVIIGKRTAQLPAFDDLLRRRNIKYLGPMDPVDFYPILKNAKGGLIAYNERRRSVNFSPLKIMNYLVAGIPTITNSVSEIGSLESSCIFTIITSGEMKAVCDKLCAGALKMDVAAANNYLEQNTIEVGIEKVIRAIGE